MAYPLAKAPSFTELTVLLRGLNCHLRESQWKVAPKNGGDPAPVRYFERDVDGETIQCVVAFDDPEERVTPSVIRSICARLRLDPAFFGLTIG